MFMYERFAVLKTIYLRYESKNNRKCVDVVEKKQKSQRNIPRQGDVVLRTSES